MNCQKAGDLLSAYIEGEVAGRPCADLEAHLSGCGDCREELETLRSALVLLAAPKTLVRPEGLLEEFKAKYLPEAETAAAPRWGFRVPVLPKIEWPSLSRLMVPMGSMAAAGAAAALIVALHAHSGAVVPAPAGPPPAGMTVATNQVPHDTASPGTEQGEPHSASVTAEKTPAAPQVRRAAKPMKVPASEPRRSVRHQALRVAVAPTGRHRLPRPEYGFASEPRATHRVSKRSRWNRFARLDRVKVELPASGVRQYTEVERSPELQWQAANDQGGAVMHKATAPVAEDGYAEASCKNLATGKVLRSEAFSIPSEPTPAGPVVGRSSGSR